ncbi:MAG: helicase C-terminal domain-containing protein [Bacillota bacterium]|nr:helicase C-terminal domain-containing protein [Bacillota bacterium]
MTGSAGAFQTYTCIDLKTTGLDPARDRIVELAAVRFSGGQAVETYSALVNPGCPLPPAVARLTGLSDDDLRRQPTLDEVLPEYLRFLGTGPLVGHNVRFDLQFLGRAAQAHGLDAAADGLDTLALARALWPMQQSYALESLAQRLGHAGPGVSHRAASDALSTGMLLEQLRLETERYPLRVLGAAMHWLDPAREQMAPLYGFLRSAWESSLRSTSAQPEMEGAGAAGPSGPGDARAAKGEPPSAGVPRGKLTSVLPWAFGLDGLLAGHLPDFEVRHEQTEMCNAILGCMLGGGSLAVEAGTGVGKSLAYLLPAVAVAESREQRVVVSTHTVTLQDQLAEKDLPLLARAVGREVRFAVLKGRSNYLCRRKWEAFLGGSLVADEVERTFGLRILFWLERTATADRAELNLTPDEDGCWGLVSSGEDCWGRHCPHAGRCHGEAAREAASRADLVIANHALVCADLATDNRVLPAYEHLVVDEAQHFEDVATDHLGLEVSRQELAALTGALGGGRRGRGGSRRMLVPLTASGGDAAAAETAAVELRAAAGRALAAVDDFFTLLGTAWPGGATGADDTGPSEIRYGPDMAGLPAGCSGLGRAAAEALAKLAREAAKRAELLPENDGPGQELAGLSRALAVQAAGLGHLTRADRGDWVYWLAQRAGQVNLRGAPIAVGERLHEELWGKLRSRVLVSATLSVAGRFDHFLGRTGLVGPVVPPADTVLLSSPFDFRRQVLMCVPDDLPLPGTGEAERDYAASIAEFLAGLLPATSGRALVLFTSHRLLRMVHGLVAPELAAGGLNVYAQGVDGGRSRLVRALRGEERTVVFGSSTFWEGIDVRGPQLSCLVITKLPFPRPDDPLVAARQEQLASQGRSPFDHYSLPQAVLRFKQGFGRLIRSASDRGVVVVLDGRLLYRRYGRTFANSLPEVTWYRGPGRQVVSRVRRFLENPSPSPSGVSWVPGERSADDGPRGAQYEGPN